MSHNALLESISHDALSSATASCELCDGKMGACMHIRIDERRNDFGTKLIYLFLKKSTYYKHKDINMHKD